METGKLNRTIRFKFGRSLRKGTKVQIAEVKENTCLVRIASEPNLEYLVMKDAITKTDNVQPLTAQSVDVDYISVDECKGFGIHLEQCDADGYCNHCGNN